MRKITLLFCALLLVPTLTLANGDMVSISELRQQVEMMGRWTQTYDTPNGEVSVDIPIIVPDVDEFLKSKRLRLMMMEFHGMKMIGVFIFFRRKIHLQNMQTTIC